MYIDSNMITYLRSINEKAMRIVCISSSRHFGYHHCLHFTNEKKLTLGGYLALSRS